MLRHIALAQIVMAAVDPRAQFDQHRLVANAAAGFATIFDRYVGLRLRWTFHAVGIFLMFYIGIRAFARLHRLHCLGCSRTPDLASIGTRRGRWNTGHVTHGTSLRTAHAQIIGKRCEKIS